MNLVAVLFVCAMIIVVWSSQVGALVFAALGVTWTALMLRSGIDVGDDGFTVRGILRTRRLSWADVDAFIVLGYAGSGRRALSVDYVAPAPGGSQVVGLTIDAIEGKAVATPVPMFSVVAAVTSQGERYRVHGTASTPLDPEFPAQAAAELNRRLRQHRAGASAG